MVTVFPSVNLHAAFAGGLGRDALSCAQALDTLKSARHANKLAQIEMVFAVVKGMAIPPACNAYVLAAEFHGVILPRPQRTAKSYICFSVCFTGF
jgi:hypothetical protein